MSETLSSEIRFRAKVNDRVPPNELLAWAEKIEALEQLRTEAENVIGMAHSFANFPSWLESLEKQLKESA